MTAIRLQTRVEATVPGLADILNIVDPFGQEATFERGYEAILAIGANLASSRDIAKARIQMGRNDSVSARGSWVREGLIYFPNQKPLFVLESPLVDLQKAQDATSAHRSGKDFYLDDSTLLKYTGQAEEDATKNPEEKRVLRLGSNGYHAIPTNRFAEDQITRFLFKDVAAPYGTYLNSEGIKEMPVALVDNYEVNRQTRPFVRQLWFRRISYGGNSGLSGNCRDLNIVGEEGPRGVRAF